MRTIWTGTDLIMEFSGRQIVLTTEETKEFEAWVLERCQK